MKPNKKGVSTAIFVASVVILIIIAASGFTLYGSNMNAKTSTNTVTTTVSGGPGTTVTTTISGQTMSEFKTGGFANDQLVTFGYTSNYTCTPAMNSFGFNSTETTNAAKFTGCEVGGGNAAALPGAETEFVLIPAYAGLSIFGVPSLGATSQGYPVFNNTPIFTQCGAGGSASGCLDHPTYFYSPDFTLVEQHIGIKSGVFGLPEGVLPTPAHDHLVNTNNSASIPWYIIAVLVFDPNVMPNAATGSCTQVVDSNLTNPTANCLNSFTNLEAALNTKTTATANANATQNDPIYGTFGGVATQVLIPGVTMVSETSPANTNLFLYFSVSASNPYS